MSAGNEGFMSVGQATVVTTNETGLPVEHWVERLLERIIYVGKQSHPTILAQAEAFKDSIRNLLLYYMKQAVQTDRTTVYNLLLKAGETEAAEIIRRL